MYFQKTGKENTDKTIKMVKESALTEDISNLVVASCSGETAEEFLLTGMDIVSQKFLQ